MDGRRTTTYVCVCVCIYCAQFSVEPNKCQPLVRKTEGTKYTWSDSRFPKLGGIVPRVPLGGCAYMLTGLSRRFRPMPPSPDYWIFFCTVKT